MQSVLRYALFAVVLGSVNLTRQGSANGTPLPAGTYQIRLTDDAAPAPKPGQSPGAERWVEFVRGGKVVAKEVATVISNDDMRVIAKGMRPANNKSLVQTLLGGDYVRVWIVKDKVNYLINMPTRK